MPDERRHVVCPAAALPPGERRIVELAGRSIGLFNVGGRLFALHNGCPHRGGPLCEGRLGGTTLSPRARDALALLDSLTRPGQPSSSVLRAANAVEVVWEDLKP